MPTVTPPPDSRPEMLRILLGAAAIVVIVFGIRAAAGIITPVLLAGFLAIVIAPALFKLRQRRIPTLVALPMLAVPLVLVMLFLSLLLQSSITSFQNNIEMYEHRLAERKQELIGSLRQMGVDVPDNASFGEFDPGQARRWASLAFSAFSGLLTNAFLVVVLVLLMLLESSGLTDKLRAVRHDSDGMIDRVGRILASIRHYLLLKAAVSAATALAAYLVLLVFGVEFPLLWAFLAFLLNFVPNIGSIIAAVPPVLLAFILDGGGSAVGVAVGYLAINTIIGNVLEPMWMGQGVGLSALVVFLSLLFWSWVLGIIGALLSVPLTMTCKIILDSDPSTRWVAVLLGPNAESANGQNG